MLIYLRSKKIEMYIIEKDQMQEFATDMKAIYQCFVYYLGPSDHTPTKSQAVPRGHSSLILDSPPMPSNSALEEKCQRK